MVDKIVQARQSFSVPFGGIPVFVAEGELWDASDPVVKGRETLFGEPDVHTSAGISRRAAPRRGKQETADAAPGAPRSAVPAPAPAASPAKATKSVKQDPPPSEV